MSARDDGRPYVYPPQEDSWLLAAAAARAARGLSVLELFAGSGVAALAAARAGARRIVATDLNPHALRALRQAARRARLPLGVVRTDLARGLGRFDLVLANPPYLPTQPAERDPDRWANLALDGGPTGRRPLARLLRTLPGRLTADGRALVVVSDRQVGLAALRAAWARTVGPVRTVRVLRLAGERLALWELRRRPRPTSPPPGPRRGARRTGPRARGTPPRPRGRRPRRSGSNPGSGAGRTPAPGAASGRRRSRRRS